MAVWRFFCKLAMVVAAIILLSCAMQTAAFAQSPDDLYQSGPDPIAPELPGSDSETTAAQSATDKNGKDKENELDFLDKSLTEISRTPVTSTAMGMEVSTVSRTESSVGKSPTAVYVITNEMIRRSGARNLPEVLRLAPGVEVAQITKTSWAISIRGFNARYGNKLLVQIDGRAVYNPAFGGVYWDMQQVLLDDVDRIEVIRGPGATVWGSNAVNGVINIVTKSSAETKGIYAYTGGGDEHRSFNAIRAGGRQGELNWRVYGMQADDAPGYLASPGVAWDAMQFGQGGFRMDWTPTCRDTLTLQGDFLGQRETARQTTFVGFADTPENNRSTNFLGRWTRKLDDETDWSVQMYYDNWCRLATGSFQQHQNQNTFDLDSQYHTKLGDRHDVVCGFGYRNYETLLETQGAAVIFNPPRDSFDIISYFFQDTIELRPERLFLTAGIKLEHNDFTNFEYQPTIRLLAAPDDRTSIWGAVSRAVRTPAIIERDILVFGMFQGSRDVRSEDLIAYEAGMRRQPTDRLYWDLAVFFNRYDNLVGLSPLFPLPSTVSNVGQGDTYGYELVVTYEMNPNWRLRGSYSFLVEDINYMPNSGAYIATPGANPRNQCFLHSAWDLTETTTLDMIFRYVDNLAVGVPHYLVMDVRWAWEPRDGLEIAIVGQNLLDDHHPEFVDYSGVTEVPAGVYGMITLRR